MVNMNSIIMLIRDIDKYVTIEIIDINNNL